MWSITILIATLFFCAKAFHEETLERWNKFKASYGKSYENEIEEANSLYNFLQHETFIQSYRHPSFVIGINEFADQSFLRFKSATRCFKNEERNVARSRSNYTHFFANSIEGISRKKLPKSVDWRKKGYVTNIKNQGNCGSCYAFSATGSLEGQLKRKHGKLISLSEQNIVDCSQKEGNMGCNGGLMDYSFQYIQDNGGLDSEISYPYLGRREKMCYYNKSGKAINDIGFVDIPEGDEVALAHALSTIGPISVAIDANHVSFMLYKSGVYFNRHCSRSMLDHGVLVVGYGETKKGEKYWIIKNSWGESWGEKGYIRMAKDKMNMCGIASSASYPLVK